MEKQFTATTYIIEKQRVLLLYHLKLQKWLPPGGHIEKNETPPEAARREVLEETGLQIEFLKQENIWLNHWNAHSFERPYLCLLEEIPAYKETVAHQHMDFIYLAKPAPFSNINTGFTEQIRWFSKEELDVLKVDVEIFAETLNVISHLFSTLEHS